MTAYERNGMTLGLAREVVKARDENDYNCMTALAGRASWPAMLREALRMI